MLNLIPFLEPIARQYRLDPRHAHGLSHWARVLENGLKLSELEGGDTTVISLFAVFHDACRHNQALDPGHGARAAKLAADLLGDQALVSSSQLELLVQACRDHTDGMVQADLTIQICWDADRLDLARVGIRPLHGRLCTRSAKEPELLSWAIQRSRSGYSPGYVEQLWLPIFRSEQQSA